MVALLLLQPRGWEIVRARLTYPRVGHVELRRDGTRQVLPGVLSFIFLVAAAMAIALVVFGGLQDPSLWWQWLPLFVGMMLVGALAHAHSKSGSARYSVFAMLAAGAGLLASLLSFASAESRLVAYLGKHFLQHLERTSLYCIHNWINLCSWRGDLLDHGILCGEEICTRRSCRN